MIADEIIARLTELSPAGLARVQAALKKLTATQKARVKRDNIITLAQAVA
jgi:hypothetical protein